MESEPVLKIENLHVFRGTSPVLRGISLKVGPTALALVGRNGMGKTTLCEALIGFLPRRAGSIRLNGQEISGFRSFRIARAGIGYVPQGRRIFSSLSVDEHLRMVVPSKTGLSPWSVERVYTTFPRLAERRRNIGSNLSGGEQQMLAIGRALLLNPLLLVVDEPTEGLAPIIVDHLAGVFRKLQEEGMAMLLVEQNIAFATAIAERLLVMVNGRIAFETDAKEFGSNVELQRQHLGIRNIAVPRQR